MVKNRFMKDQQAKGFLNSLGLKFLLKFQRLGIVFLIYLNIIVGKNCFNPTEYVYHIHEID